MLSLHLLLKKIFKLSFSNRNRWVLWIKRRETWTSRKKFLYCWSNFDCKLSYERVQIWVQAWLQRSPYHMDHIIWSIYRMRANLILEWFTLECKVIDERVTIKCKLENALGISSHHFWTIFVKRNISMFALIVGLSHKKVCTHIWTLLILFEPMCYEVCTQIWWLP